MSSAEERPDPSRSSAQGSEPGPAEPNGASGNETSRDAASDEAATDSDRTAEHETPRLAPIPPEGTAAPASEHGDFGRGSATSKTGTKTQQGGATTSSPTGTSPDGGSPQPDQDGAGQHGPGVNNAGGPGPGSDSDGGSPHPPPEPLGDEARRKVLTRGRLALVLGIGALVFSVPLFPMGLALGVAALVLGITARRHGRRAALVVPGARPGIVLGIVATVLASLVTSVAVMFYDEIIEWQDCLGAANTHSGEEICQDAFQERLNDRFDTLTARAPGL